MQRGIAASSEGWVSAKESVLSLHAFTAAASLFWCAPDLKSILHSCQS